MNFIRLLVALFALILLMPMETAVASTQSTTLEVPPLENRILFIFLKVGEILDLHGSIENGSLYVQIEDGNGNFVSKYEDDKDFKQRIVPASMDGDYKIILENTSLERVKIKLEYSLTPEDPSRQIALNPNGTAATSMTGLFLLAIIVVGSSLVGIVVYEKIRYNRRELNEAN